jgi:hypothetical protein
MSNCVQYMLFATLIFSIGWVLRNPPEGTKVISEKMMPKPQKDNDESFDEWFEEMRQNK